MVRLVSRIVATVCVALAVLLGVSAGPAQADELHHVDRTDGDGVYLHSVPVVQDGLLGVLPEGSEFNVQCWTYGEDVLGNPIWLYGSSSLGSGYVTDYYIDTTWNTTSDLDAQGIPTCGSAAATEPAPTPVPSTAGWQPSCGPSQYFERIDVLRWGGIDDGKFQIVAWPKLSTRIALDANAATISQWHAIQACVPGLYGTLADSIWDQLECHQHLAVVPGRRLSPYGGFVGEYWITGNSYDLESWRPTFGIGDWLGSHCGNELNVSADPTTPVL